MFDGVWNIRGLTLWQPMAWAISDLPAGIAKRIENRPWAPWKGVTHVAIHAGARYHRPHADQIDDVFGMRPPPKKHLPSGAIVAIARIASCVTASDDPWFSGPYGWVLRDVVRVPEPIACKGALGLWRILEPIEMQLRRIYGKNEDSVEPPYVESDSRVQPNLPGVPSLLRPGDGA